jgi:hypothetical protein
VSAPRPQGRHVMHPIAGQPVSLQLCRPQSICHQPLHSSSKRHHLQRTCTVCQCVSGTTWYQAPHIPKLWSACNRGSCGGASAAVELKEQHTVDRPLASNLEGHLDVVIASKAASAPAVAVELWDWFTSLLCVDGWGRDLRTTEPDPCHFISLFTCVPSTDRFSK